MKGSCLCGAVTFASDAAPDSAGACHCTQCRKWSGHVWGGPDLPDDGLEVRGEVRWFASSPGIRRGFCPVCGASLFWKREGSAVTSVALGALDDAPGLRLRRHIFTAFKGDYYEIADGVPQS